MDEKGTEEPFSLDLCKNTIVLKEIEIFRFAFQLSGSCQPEKMKEITADEE